MHRRLPNVIEGASAMQSSLASRTVSNIIHCPAGAATCVIGTRDDLPSKIIPRTDAAAFSMAVAAGGAVKAFKTTPLLSVEEGVEAMRKAHAAGYRRPSG